MNKTINVNITYRIIVFILIYIFGFYGWGVTDVFSTTNLFKEVVIAITIVAAILLSYSQRYTLRSKIALTIEKRELVTLFSLMCILFFSNFWILNDALTVDEIAYAWISQLHSYVLLFKIAELKYNLLLGLQSNLLLHLLSMTVFGSIIFAIRLLSKIKNEKTFLVVALSLLFSLRITVSFLGGGESPHAPLGYLFYFVVSSVFGSSTWVFRITTLILFTFTSMLTLSFLRSRIQSYLVFISVTLAIYSIPLIHNMLLIVEVSIWAYLLNNIVLIFLYSRSFEIPSSLLIIIAFFTYFRMSMFATLAALWVAYIAQNWGKTIFNNHLRLAIAITLPSLVLNIFERLRSNGLVLPSVLDTLENNIKNYSFALENSGSRVAVLLSLITLLFFIYRYPFSRILLLCYTFFNAIFFLLLNSPSLSFVSKYIIEWCLSLLSLGVAHLCTMCSSNLQKLKIALVALVFAAYSQIFLMKEVEANFKELYNSKANLLAYSAIPRIPMPYEKAYEFLRRQDDYCLAVGPVYSVFPEMINGFDINHVVYLKDLRTRFLSSQSLTEESWLTVSSKTLEEAGVNCVLLGFTENDSRNVAKLLNNEWFLVNEYRYDTYGTSVYILKIVPR